MPTLYREAPGGTRGAFSLQSAHERAERASSRACGESWNWLSGFWRIAPGCLPRPGSSTDTSPFVGMPVADLGESFRSRSPMASSWAI